MTQNYKGVDSIEFERAKANPDEYLLHIADCKHCLQDDEALEAGDRVYFVPEARDPIVYCVSCTDHAEISMLNKMANEVHGEPAWEPFTHPKVRFGVVVVDDPSGAKYVRQKQK